MNVNDLNIERDVLPLFDFTNNSHSYEEMFKFFKEVPRDLDEVLKRQELIKGFIGNWSVLNNFSYKVLYLHEVYSFLDDIAEEKIVFKKSKLKTLLALTVSEEERNQWRSRFVQVVIILDEFSSKFLSRIDKTKFSVEFSFKIEQNILFLRKIRLEYFAESIRENTFTISRIVEFMQILISLGKNEIKEFWKFFFQFEAYFSIAKSVIKNNFSFAKFNKDKFLIDDFFHPLIIDPVKNSLSLSSSERVIVLTGPNMSGKSTLLKSIGLCVYLSHLGLGVPASNCEIPYFDSITIAINTNDHLSSGYSHFMVEIKNLKSVLENATKGASCFAIFDELFKGTNIDDAQDITLTTIEGLPKFKNCCFFISTHLLQLENQIPHSENISNYFIDSSLEKGIPAFSYKLTKGWSNLRIGKIIFELEGLRKMLK